MLGSISRCCQRFSEISSISVGCTTYCGLSKVDAHPMKEKKVHPTINVAADKLD